MVVGYCGGAGLHMALRSSMQAILEPLAAASWIVQAPPHVNHMDITAPLREFERNE